MKKPIPEFKNEAEEFEFWSSTGPGADSTKYIDWSKAKRARLPNLSPTLSNGGEPTQQGYRDDGEPKSGA
jgi:hypothetical protein